MNDFNWNIFIAFQQGINDKTIEKEKVIMP